LLVSLAENAGFCNGVRRAVKIAEESTEEKTEWYTLGPLVHNDDVINHFKQRGIAVLDNIEEIHLSNDEPERGIIIRSHGVSPELIERAREKGFKIKDATCPLVKRVHDIVRLLSDAEYDIVIFGDSEHPEVQGIAGWSGQNVKIVANLDEARLLGKTAKLGLVSQTTKDEKEFFAVAAALLDTARELRVFNTICSATRKRQEAAWVICQDVDLMLVVGDRKSSNTNTLFKECVKTGVKTFRIMNASEIEADWFRGISKTGITAGASTPDWIIKEVLDRMTDYEENKQEQQETMEQEIQEQSNLEEESTEQLSQEQDSPQVAETSANEESFAKMEAEMAGFASPSRGDIIKGIVIQVLDDDVMVDVGGKSEGIIPLRELSLKDVESAKELVAVGDEIEVKVLKWDDDGTILLSKKRVDSEKELDRLEQYAQEDKIIEGTIIESVKGGLLVDVGIIAFLPASHVDDGYVKNLDEYIGQTLEFKIIEFNRNKRRGSQIVLSRRELVAEEKARLKEHFWQEIEEGQTRTGKIKRIVDYGAFIDLGGYEGLLHVSEIDHRRIEHPSNVLNEGDELDVYILALDREKERVSLSRKKLLKSPWEIVVEKYQEGDIIEGTIVRIASFGAFVEIEPGVDGLVHISQMADFRVEKPEDVVSVGEKANLKILSIDPGQKRIGLSIKEARNDMESQEVEDYLENQEDNE